MVDIRREPKEDRFEELLDSTMAGLVWLVGGLVVLVAIPILGPFYLLGRWLKGKGWM